MARRQSSCSVSPYGTKIGRAWRRRYLPTLYYCFVEEKVFVSPLPAAPSSGWTLTQTIPSTNRLGRRTRFTARPAARVTSLLSAQLIKVLTTQQQSGVPIAWSINTVGRHGSTLSLTLGNITHRPTSYRLCRLLRGTTMKRGRQLNRVSTIAFISCLPFPGIRLAGR